MKNTPDHHTPGAEHFDLLIEDYNFKIDKLQKQPQTESVKEQIKKIQAQKFAVELAKRSYLDDI